MNILTKDEIHREWLYSILYHDPEVYCLTEQQGKVLICLRCGLSHKETAEALEIPSHQVKVVINALDKRHQEREGDLDKDINQVLRNFPYDSLKEIQELNEGPDGKLFFTGIDLFVLKLFKGDTFSKDVYQVVKETIPRFLNPLFQLDILKFTKEQFPEFDLEKIISSRGTFRVYLHRLRAKAKEFIRYNLEHLAADEEIDQIFHEAASPHQKAQKEQYFKGEPTEEDDTFSSPGREFSVWKIKGVRNRWQNIEVHDQKTGNKKTIAVTNPDFCEECPQKHCRKYCQSCANQSHSACWGCTLCINKEYTLIDQGEANDRDRDFDDRVAYSVPTATEKKIDKEEKSFVTV